MHEPHLHRAVVKCDCGGGIETCAQLGPIPVYGVCVGCGAEYTVQVRAGVRFVDPIGEDDE